MKKIALICDDHIACDLPLAKALIDAGNVVDMYLWIERPLADPEAMSCTFSPTKIGLQEIPQKYWCDVAFFMNSPNFKLYCIYIPLLCRQIKYFRVFYSRIVHTIKSFIDVSVINSKKYDFVDFVGRYNSFSYFLNYIKWINAKKCVSLHEVYDHYNGVMRSNKLIKYLIRNDIKVVLHSKNTYDRFLMYKGVKSENLALIHFGLFNSYKSIVPTDVNLPEDFSSGYALFYGSITPYKGLKVLYHAIQKLGRSDIRIVIAGKGNDEVLDCMKNDSRFYVINRYITNAELVTLIVNSRIVICPYLSMSQSGIPQTVFSMGKAIIASDLDGFKGLIKDGVNSVLFKVNDSESLSKALNEYYFSSSKIRVLEEAIDKFEYYNPLYSWKTIAEEYLKLI